jgi:PepSY-associated TM region
MWFASGIVMHFVPFPELTEAERFAGLAVLDPSAVKLSPAEAVAKSALHDIWRVRLWQRSDGPVYLISAASGMTALRADDLSGADIRSGQLALEIASRHAGLRGLDHANASVAELADYDQWTVSNGLDPHRPLYRIALNDAAGTELYVSSHTGEVLRDTTQHERTWNYMGSVAHWIYPTILRKNWMAWNVTVWWLSLIAVIAALSGVALGIVRMKIARGRLSSPYRRWHAWHHWLGLFCTIFVTTWIVSGWLSMDHGRFFSTGHVTRLEADRIAGSPDWSRLTSAAIASLPSGSREVEWFAFGNEIYERERITVSEQKLRRLSAFDDEASGFLSPDQVNAVFAHAVPGCTSTAAIQPGDPYPIDSDDVRAPVYRTICAEAWYHTDAASGANLERLDSQRRAYRWLYRALHTLDFPALMRQPELRTILIVVLCAVGFAFSVTGVVIAWRRLRLQLR